MLLNQTGRWITLSTLLLLPACSSNDSFTTSPPGARVQSGTESVTFAKMSVGFAHTCGIDAANGDAYCWGANSAGEIGNGVIGTGAPDATKYLVVGRHAWAEITAGLYFTCGITIQGETYCWGQKSPIAGAGVTTASWATGRSPASRIR